MNSVREAKKAMRTAVRAAVLALGPDERRDQERTILAEVGRLPAFREPRTVLLYVSFLPDEVPTMGLVHDALARGQVVALPRVDRPSRRLCLHRIDDPARDLVAGTLGIPEPRDGIDEMGPELIDSVLVPGVAFDMMGHRLGRGAGYYDRLLPRLRPGVPRWSLALGPMWVEAVPREPHDEPIDIILGADRRFDRTVSLP
jgi:5-formyltetrahydrofolate cyclo-ligase